jgi:hypothetical protein
MVLDNSPAAVAAGMVAIACLGVAAAAWRATLRTGNRNIVFVVAAFLVLGLKNLAKAAELLGGVESGLVELGFSLTDLLAVGLIAWPLLSPRTGAAP